MTGTPGAPPGGASYDINYRAELPEVMGRKLGLTDVGVALGQGQQAFTQRRARKGALDPNLLKQWTDTGEVNPAYLETWDERFAGALAGQDLPQQDIAGYGDEEAFLASDIPAQFRGAAQDIAGAEGGIGGYQDYLTKAQTYMGPDAYQQFLNPYQDYVTAGIEEQFGKARTAAEAQATQTGAFGGARQGLQMAELTRQQAEAVGASKAQGFGQAQQLAGQAAQQQLGLAGQSQQMAMGDISTLMQTGTQQQQLQQQVYDERYRRALQEQYEPYQRLGFVSDIMQGAPTSASSLAMATTPQANPLAQAVGAGISGLALYQGYQNVTGNN
jgi:hypothetical protein